MVDVVYARTVTVLERETDEGEATDESGCAGSLLGWGRMVYA